LTGLAAGAAPELVAELAVELVPLAAVLDPLDEQPATVTAATAQTTAASFHLPIT
jgi:hypothetical protein